LMVLMLWLTSRVKPFRVLLSQGIDEARFLTDNVLEVAAKSNDIFPGFIQAVHKTKDIQQ
jgi:hypothetical protein